MLNDAASYFPQNLHVVLRIRPENTFFRFVEMVYDTTILCIDDDLDDLSFIQEAIRQHETRFNVVAAKDGELAMAYLQQAKTNGSLPCLIIMDINMPKMDGKKAIQLIKADKQLSGIPLVIFTTSSSITDKKYFEPYNVHYITKPNQYAAFVKTVMEMLALHQRLN
jgi:CheY-like chemotaxis protein